MCVSPLQPIRAHTYPQPLRPPQDLARAILRVTPAIPGPSVEEDAHHHQVDEPPRQLPVAYRPLGLALRAELCGWFSWEESGWVGG